MPRRSEPESQSTALIVPEDIRDDLLRAQAEQIDSIQRLPQLKVMAAGAGLFEFGDTNDMPREVVGVILGAHRRNVLWDKPMSEAPAPAGGDDENKNRPACTSQDGTIGVPREGFRHLHPDLQGVPAVGTEELSCQSCTYNQWRSKSLIDPTNPNAKGKACTNRKSVYIVIEGRNTPVELDLSPTSLPPFDEYVSTLTNRSLPMQAIFTKFSLETKGQGRQKWCIVKFEHVGTLTTEQFQDIMAKRAQYMSIINPSIMAPAVGQADEPDAEPGEAKGAPNW